MRAKKDNKVYMINEAQKDRYLSEGFDIYDEEGNVIEYSPKKKVLYSDYVKLQNENAKLKAQIETLMVEQPDTEKIPEAEEKPKSARSRK